MQYAMYCESGHRIDFIDPETGERERRYIGDFQAVLLDADADGNLYPLPKFCADCGAKTMSKCHGCGVYIQYNDSRSHYVPNYCTKCGVAFPWTTAAIQTVSKYTDELDGLNDEDKATLKAAYPELTRDTPKTDVAIGRFKKVYAKLAPAAATVVRGTIQTVLTEYVKHSLKF
jgi:hypothetical protein